MSVPLSGKQSFQHRLGGFLVKAMLGIGAGLSTEGLFQEGDADTLRAADFLATSPGSRALPLTISANRASRTEMILPSWAKPAHRLDPERRAGPWRDRRVFSGNVAVGVPECRQHLSGVARIEEIDEQRCSRSGDEIDLQVPHEPAGGQPEIIPHHHDRLDMLAIALTKSGDQFRVLLTPLGMEPLLELVQDQQHLALGWQDATLSQVRQRIDQPQFSRQFRTNLAQALRAAELRSPPGSPRCKPAGRACRAGAEVPP